MCVELTGQKQSAGVLASIGGKSEGKSIQLMHLIQKMFW